MMIVGQDIWTHDINDYDMFEYYDGPLSFILLDTEGNRYYTHWTDKLNFIEQEYYLVKISKEKENQIRNNEISVLDVFLKSESKTFWRMRLFKYETVVEFPISKLDLKKLPAPDVMFFESLTNEY